MIVKGLLSFGRTDEAMRFYDDQVKAAGSVESLSPQLSSEFIQAFAQNPKAPTALSAPVSASDLLLLQTKDAALKLFDHIQSQLDEGARFGKLIPAFDAIFALHIAANDVEAVVALWGKLKRQGLLPSDSAMVMLLAFLGAARP